jgi:hypothetical protein
MKAQRALTHEQVTIVGHATGWVHCFYREATIDEKAYGHFRRRLGEFLSSEMSPLMLANFLRAHHEYQKYFQICRDCRGEKKFIKAEILYHYEHGSRFRIGDETFDKLLDEVSPDDFSPYQVAERLCCEQLWRFMEAEKIEVRRAEGRAALAGYLARVMPDGQTFAERLARFVHTEARLPAAEKAYVKTEPIKLGTDMGREEVMEYLQGMRGRNETADLAFYAYRDMTRCAWAPFMKAAVERSPVSIVKTAGRSLDEVAAWLAGMPEESIYDAGRLAQPDEVANFGRGDGAEKALLLANVMRARHPGSDIEVILEGGVAVVRGSGEYRFSSTKGLRQRVRIMGDGKIETDAS